MGVGSHERHFLKLEVVAASGVQIWVPHGEGYREPSGSLGRGAGARAQGAGWSSARGSGPVGHAGGDTAAGRQAEGKGCRWEGTGGPSPHPRAGVGARAQLQTPARSGRRAPRRPGQAGVGRAAFALPSEAPGAKAGLGVLSFLSDPSLVSLRSGTPTLPREPSP